MNSVVHSNSDLTDLQRLHDIVLPSPTPLWPPAPGWLWLGAIVTVALLALALKLLVRHQQNRYRREALKLLDNLQAHSTGTQQQPEALYQLSVILKRTALTAYGRPQAAPLTGEDWFAFLDHHAATAFSQGPGQVLERSNLHLPGEAPSAEQLQLLFTEARRWIKQHEPATGRSVP